MVTSPRVFISYSHDSDEHAAHVLAFANYLRALGIDAVIDQYTPVPPEGWPLWMETNLDQADFVLMVCTETYYRRVMRREQPGKGKGVQWEGTLIYNRLYNNLAQGDRYLPILFEEGQAAYIPGPTQGHTYFTIKKFDLSDAQFQALYRHLTGQLSTPKPELGSLAILPPRSQPTVNPLSETLIPGTTANTQNIASVGSRRPRVKQDFDSIQKAEFADEAFEIIKNYFDASCKELNTVDSLKAKFEMMDATAFTCTVVNRSKQRGGEAHITVRNNKRRTFFGDINYLFQRYAEANSSNGSFSVSADDYHMFLTSDAMSMMMGVRKNRNTQLSAEEAAEELWDNFIKQAGIEYD